MKKTIWSMLFVFMTIMPGMSYAKGAPLFFQTGDELFKIDGAPSFDGGYSAGYACQRFGLFGADIWTWDCNLMAVNLEEFSVAELGQELKAKMKTKYTPGDRVRNPWNHYGIVVLGLVLVGMMLGKRKTAS